MKSKSLLFAAAAAFIPLLAVAAQPVKSGLPPPEMDAKGVATKPASIPEADSVKPAESVKPDMPDTRLVRDKASRSKDPSAAEIEASSDSMTERKEGNDTVKEYRQKGKLRMVRIVPQNGPAQTYLDRNSDGRLDKDPMEGPVAPVYFTIYEWN